MNYQKLDGSLARELDQGPGGGDTRYSVFVRATTPMPAEAIAELRRLGVSSSNPHASVVTLELSADEVKSLSDRPWVSGIRLSKPLRPLG